MHFIRCVAIVGLTVATHLPQDANAMSSDNYSIPFSAANAGGTTMTSANFGLMGSVGEESASSPMNSASNNAGTGFIAQLYNVTRLNPVTGAGTNFALPANASSPSAVAFDGVSIWFTSSIFLTGTVTRINPASGVGANIPLPAGATGAVGIAFDGTNIWTTNSGTWNVSKFLR